MEAGCLPGLRYLSPETVTGISAGDPGDSCFSCCRPLSASSKSVVGFDAACASWLLVYGPPRNIGGDLSGEMGLSEKDTSYCVGNVNGMVINHLSYDLKQCLIIYLSI